MNRIDHKPSKVTAIAHPNIAFIKYWGNTDDALRLPANGSISMNLAKLETVTSVRFDSGLNTDQITLNDQISSGASAKRINDFLDIIRVMAGFNYFAEVISKNNFPSGSGIASSASGFAALALAGSTAAGLSLNTRELSCLARRGSGSACRSIPAGFTEWQPGKSDETSFAVQLAPETHWDLVDLVVILDSSEKKVGSTAGHGLAPTSRLQSTRIADTPRRLNICRKAILEKDFKKFAEIVEEDCLQMHGVMMTSQPPLIYWQPGTLSVIHLIQNLRKQGLDAAFTIDAGANVHAITRPSAIDSLKLEIAKIPLVQQIIESSAGGPTRIVS